MARRRGTTTAQIHAAWWEPHETVLIRERVTHGDQKLMYANMAKARIAAGTKDTEISFQLLEVQGAMVKTMVLDWTLTDEHGNRIKFNADAVDDLAGEDLEYIAEEIAKRNPTMTPEERAAFFAQQKTAS